MSAAKAKGTRWESLIVDFLKGHGWAQAERRALSGNKDRGDIAGVAGVVIEAKSQSRHSLGEWLDEAATEKANADAPVGLVWFKRRGHTSPGKGYVLMDGETLVTLLKAGGWQ